MEVNLPALEGIDVRVPVPLRPGSPRSLLQWARVKAAFLTDVSDDQGGFLYRLTVTVYPGCGRPKELELDRLLNERELEAMFPPIPAEEVMFRTWLLAESDLNRWEELPCSEPS